MPKIISYQNVSQKSLITTDPEDLPVGSIVFWHNHRLLNKPKHKEQKKDAHIVNPELFTHVGIVIDYDDDYPIVAHATYEKKNPKSPKKPIQAVIACRIRAIDDRKERQSHSFIVFKPNEKNREHYNIINHMVAFAKTITHRNKQTGTNDYDIPYGYERSEKMTAHMKQLNTSFKPTGKKIKYSNYLKAITKRQLEETQYGFYHFHDYNEQNTPLTISDEPLNMYAGALVPFKNIAQFHHEDYQGYQKEMEQSAFTSKGFMCVQFIVWLAQCATIEAQYTGHELTHNAKTSKVSVQDISLLSRKYTSGQNENKRHIKRILLKNIQPKRLFAQSDYKTLFGWLDHEGKMMAPGTLMKLLLDNSDGGGGGDEAPYLVDFFYASNSDGAEEENILDEISDLIDTLEQINLKHGFTSFDRTEYENLFEEKILRIMQQNKIQSIQSFLNRHQKSNNESFLLDENDIAQPLLTTSTEHRHTELQYIGMVNQIAQSVFLKKLSLFKQKSSNKRNPDHQSKGHPKIARLGR